MAKPLTIYHNPRCSKSRLTLALLEEHGVEPEIVKYLETPPSVAELRNILQKLGIQARELLRNKEPEYKELNLDNPAMSEDEIVQAMVSHPKLIERPIVVSETAAAIGRPPENVKALIS